jgi:hypothetical protein
MKDSAVFKSIRRLQDTDNVKAPVPDLHGDYQSWREKLRGA